MPTGLPSLRAPATCAGTIFLLDQTSYVKVIISRAHGRARDGYFASRVALPVVFFLFTLSPSFRNHEGHHGIRPSALLDGTPGGRHVSAEIQDEACRLQLQ